MNTVFNPIVNTKFNIAEKPKSSTEFKFDPLNSALNKAFEKYASDMDKTARDSVIKQIRAMPDCIYMKPDLIAICVVMLANRTQKTYFITREEFIELKDDAYNMFILNNPETKEHDSGFKERFMADLLRYFRHITKYRQKLRNL